MSEAPAPMGHNNPPLAETLAIHYSPERLLERNAHLATALGELETEAATVTAVDNEDGLAAAAAVVRKLTPYTKANGKVDEAKEAEKRPLLVASKACDAIVKLLNDPLSPTSVAGHKKRIEGLIGAYGVRKAAEEAERRRQAAIRAQAEADERAALAAQAEAAGQGKVAEVMLNQAVKQEGLADTYNAMADGPVGDLARTTTDEGTTGLRTVWDEEIVNVEALKATLGPLRDSFTLAAVTAAVRAFRIAEVAANRDPVLPGVKFTKGFTGNVR